MRAIWRPCGLDCSKAQIPMRKTLPVIPFFLMPSLEVNSRLRVFYWIQAPKREWQQPRAARH